MRVTDRTSHAEKVRRRTAARQNAARHTNPLQRRRCTLSVPAPAPEVELHPYQRKFLAEIRQPQPARRGTSLGGLELLALAGALFRGARTRRARERQRRKATEPITW